MVAQLGGVPREVRTLLLDVIAVDRAVGPVALPLRGPARSVPVPRGELDDALQLQLPPSPAHVGRAQGGHEAAGLGPELLLALSDFAQPLADRGYLAGALLFQLPRLELEL